MRVYAITLKGEVRADGVMTKEFRDFLFPFGKMIKANKSIDTRIKELESGDIQAIKYMSNYKDLSLEQVEGFLSKTFDVRKSIEEKSKINILGITISVAVITGLSEIFINNHVNSFVIKVMLVLLAIYALYSVILATSLNLLILGRHNRVFDMSPCDMLLAAEERKESIALSTELNINYNIKRNNLLYSSYGLIIRFLIVLSIFFFLVIAPKGLSSKSIGQQVFDPENVQVLKSINSSLEYQGDILKRIEKAENNDAEVLNELKSIKKLQNDISKKIDSLMVNK